MGRDWGNLCTHKRNGRLAGVAIVAAQSLMVARARSRRLDGAGKSLHKSVMRWFWAVLVLVVLAAADRAYMRGENMRLIMSFAEEAGKAFNRAADDILSHLRR
jgi:hypothetical protein